MPHISPLDRLVFDWTEREIARDYQPLITSFRERVGREPNIAKPQRMNDLVQWRKVFDHNPLFPLLLDKVRVKDWVRKRAPDLPIPETLWVGRDPVDIPDRFVSPGHVIKTNHATSQNIFPHRDELPRAKLNSRVRHWLAEPFTRGQQWGYYAIPRRVFVERLVPSNGPLVDICVRCFNGQANFVSIAHEYKTADQRYAYFELDGRRMTEFDPSADLALDQDTVAPPTLGEAAHYARILSKGLDYVRVDFIWGGGPLFFSEMTLYPASGFGRDDALSRRLFTSWLETIEVSHFFSHRQKLRTQPYAAAARRWFRALRAEIATEAPAAAEGLKH